MKIIMRARWVRNPWLDTFSKSNAPSSRKNSRKQTMKGEILSMSQVWPLGFDSCAQIFDILFFDNEQGKPILFYQSSSGTLVSKITYYFTPWKAWNCDYYFNAIDCGATYAPCQHLSRWPRESDWKRDEFRCGLRKGYLSDVRITWWSCDYR